MTEAPRSPLELLHPDGFVRRACVLGALVPDRLRPQLAAEPPYDLVVAGPPSRRAGPSWATDAMVHVAESLAPDGLAYFLPRGFERRSVRRLVAKHGLVLELELAHVPDLASSVFVVPLEPALIQFTVDELMLLRGWRGRATRDLLRRRRPFRLAFPGAFVVRRPRSRILFEWLGRLDSSRPSHAVVSRTRPAAGPGFFVLHRFGKGESRPSGFAKVAPSASSLEREAVALDSIARSASVANVEVPRVVMSSTVGAAGVLLLEPLRGRLAATLLATSPARFERITSDVSAWLSAWGRRTARPLSLTRDALEHTLLGPARVVGRHIRRGSAYTGWIERLCAAFEGRLVSASAAHNDLTMWNVVVGADGRMGVLDWEAATLRSLPLVDFYYMAADATAAAAGYVDRARAFDAAFFGAGPRCRHVAALEARLGDDLCADPGVHELSFHACWLHHAANELRSFGRGGAFVRIVDAIAANEAGVRQRFERMAHV